VKVALDLRAGGWLGGRYYLQNLALALSRLPDAERPELVGVAPDGDDADFAGLLTPARELPPDADLVFPNWNVPRRTRAAQLHWIPDLQHRRLRGTFSPLERLKREVAFVRFAVPARRIVVSSNAVRRDAARAYPPFARKLRVVPFRTVVPGDATAVDPDETLARYGLEPGYLFLPNQFWQHKNHGVAFAAAGRLGRTLVCTGATDDHRRPGYFEELTRDLPANVRILGVVPRRDYLQLLRGAAALIQPSLFEGWSSIVEDARAFGKPIALSDIPVHREQSPTGAEFFDPHDPEALVAAVARALAAPLPDERAALSAQEERVAAYARAFTSLAAEACASAGYAGARKVLPRRP
jgi:glycosyltransferase involved in cell wall biosynthesis